MKERIKFVTRHVVQNPVLQKSAQSLKPKRSILSVLGVVLFFIVPEIVGFIWGEKIRSWAHTGTLTEATEMGQRFYWLLEKLFEDGGSWIGLGIGVLLLVWLLWDWRRPEYR